MRNYLVSFSYSRPWEGDEHQALLDALEGLGAWPLLGDACDTHIIQSDTPINELYEALIEHFVPGDKLLVAEFTRPFWYGIKATDFAIQMLGRPESRPPRTSSEA